MSDKNKKPKKFRSGFQRVTTVLTVASLIALGVQLISFNKQPTNPPLSKSDQSEEAHVEEGLRVMANLGVPGGPDVRFRGYSDDDEVINKLSASFALKKDGEPLDVRYTFDINDVNNTVVTVTNSEGEVVVNDIMPAEKSSKLHELAETSSFYLANQMCQCEMDTISQVNMSLALLDLAQEAILDFDETYCDGANNAENSKQNNEKSPKSDLTSSIISNARVRTA